MTVLVIGAGVVGLTAAVRLLEAGHDIEVVARERGDATVSTVAGGLWLPYGIGAAGGELDWAARTYAVFAEEAAAGVAGVQLVDFLELLPDGGADPVWAPALPPGAGRRARAEELPPGYRDAFACVVPLVETPRYLRRLEERVVALGGHIREGTIATLDTGHELVVNCAGLGARELAGDDAVVPVRGQVLLVRPLPGPPRAIADEEGPNALAYVLPRGDVWVLGGEAAAGTWDVGVSEDASRDILARCTALVPELADAEVVGARAGLRPGRHGSVRLERDGHVVHCYGHGGAGWTLSWGCADQIVRLAGPA
jgi:D-amino-acid oxidase